METSPEIIKRIKEEYLIIPYTKKDYITDPKFCNQRVLYQEILNSYFKNNFISANVQMYKVSKIGDTNSFCVVDINNDRHIDMNRRGITIDRTKINVIFSSNSRHVSVVLIDGLRILFFDPSFGPGRSIEHFYNPIREIFKLDLIVQNPEIVLNFNLQHIALNINKRDIFCNLWVYHFLNHYFRRTPYNYETEIKRIIFSFWPIPGDDNTKLQTIIRLVNDINKYFLEGKSIHEGRLITPIYSIKEYLFNFIREYFFNEVFRNSDLIRQIYESLDSTTIHPLCMTIAATGQRPTSSCLNPFSLPL